MVPNFLRARIQDAGGGGRERLPQADKEDALAAGEIDSGVLRAFGRWVWKRTQRCEAGKWGSKQEL